MAMIEAQITDINRKHAEVIRSPRNSSSALIALEQVAPGSGDWLVVLKTANGGRRELSPILPEIALEGWLQAFDLGLEMGSGRYW